MIFTCQGNGTHWGSISLLYQRSRVTSIKSQQDSKLGGKMFCQHFKIGFWSQFCSRILLMLKKVSDRARVVADYFREKSSLLFAVAMLLLCHWLVQKLTKICHNYMKFMHGFAEL